MSLGLAVVDEAASYDGQLIGGGKHLHNCMSLQRNALEFYILIIMFFHIHFTILSSYHLISPYVSHVPPHYNPIC